eukprot:7757583-Ditylum_brightwellii.AAC.1
MPSAYQLSEVQPFEDISNEDISGESNDAGNESIVHLIGIFANEQMDGFADGEDINLLNKNEPLRSMAQKSGESTRNAMIPNWSLKHTKKRFSKKNLSMIGKKLSVPRIHLSMNHGASNKKSIETHT